MFKNIPTRLTETGYVLVDQFNPGGQSETFLISKDDTLFLLKRPLSEALSTEQKFRFQQEAEALKLLDGQGAPRVYDYSFEEEPFILMEFIKGKTLTKLVNGKPIDIEQSLDITFQILDILGKVHEIRLLHRDIKPDNVIIDEQGKVYLIDFGLCRIDQPDRGFKTPPSKELGNRFLRLPEFGKGEKVPSSVSDVTFTVGLLFYMLSGKAPNILLDEKMLYPQQRNLLPETIIKIDWVKFTFDKGFSYDVSQRFQSAEELQSFINKHSNPDQNMEQDNPADEFAMLLSTNEFKRKDDIVRLLNDAHREFIVGINEVLGGHLATGGSGPNTGSDSYSVVTSFYIVRSGYSQPLSPYNLVSKISQDLSQITYNCDFEEPSLRMGNFSPTERERVMSEYKKIGQLRGKEAIRKLIEMIKKM